MELPVRVEISGLPYPWIGLFSRDHGMYFVNPLSGQATYEKPAENKKDSGSSSRIYTESRLPYPWIACQSKRQKRVYYVHPKSNESLWERPSDDMGTKPPLPPVDRSRTRSSKRDGCKDPVPVVSSKSTKIDGGSNRTKNSVIASKSTKIDGGSNRSKDGGKDCAPSSKSKSKKANAGNQSKPRMQQPVAETMVVKPSCGAQTKQSKKSYGSGLQRPSCASLAISKEKERPIASPRKRKRSHQPEAPMECSAARPRRIKEEVPCELEDLFNGTLSLGASSDEPMDAEEITSGSQNTGPVLYCVVCDTCSLLKDPQIVPYLIKRNIVIFLSRTVQSELEGLKKRKSCYRELSIVNNLLRDYTSELSEKYTDLILLEQSLRPITSNLLTKLNDDRILASAVSLYDTLKSFCRNECRVVLLTEDNLFAVRSNSFNGIVTASNAKIRQILDKVDPERLKAPSLSLEAISALRYEDVQQPRSSVERSAGRIEPSPSPPLPVASSTVKMNDVPMMLDLMDAVPVVPETAALLLNGAEGKKKSNQRSSSVKASKPRLPAPSAKSNKNALHEERVDLFKRISGDVVNELISRFQTATTWDAKSTHQQQMDCLRLGAKRLSMAVGKLAKISAFTSFLHQLKRIFFELAAPPSYWEQLNVDDDTLSLFHYIFNNHPEILNDLAKLATDQQYDLRIDYLALS